jgi:hypothetical protein
MADEEKSKTQTSNCALCGKALSEQGVGDLVPSTVVDEIIDGSHYLFDSIDCATLFKKFGGVYGNFFYQDICEAPRS